MLRFRTDSENVRLQPANRVFNLTEADLADPAVAKVDRVNAPIYISQCCIH